MKKEVATLYQGDSAVVLREYEDNSIDAVVCDPPYGLGFMGKAWDKDVPATEIFAECFRVLKPGGHLIAFGGSRTYHHTAMRVEQVGFEVRDQLLWLYGSGFPKSLDVGKAIDKDAGVEREVVGRSNHIHSRGQSTGFPKRPGEKYQNSPQTSDKGNQITAPATPEAQQWDGWGIAMKPSHEPAVLARKPLEGRVIDNVLKYGTGGLNVDGCRVDVSENDPVNNSKYHAKPSAAYGNYASKEKREVRDMTPKGGRWPANVCHDGSEAVQDILGDKARYFYCAKANKAERNAGLEGFEYKVAGAMRGSHDGSLNSQGRPVFNKNHHPTVKPIALMRWLCRLVTPPNGIVLDPFMGSGSTGIAAIQEGFRFVGIEREAEYHEIARARIEHAIKTLQNTGIQTTLL